MGRKRAFPWRWRIAGLLLLAAIAAGGWIWWQAQHWAPERAAFPIQGALIGAIDGQADFRALRAIGADFVYLEGSQGASGRDPAFAANLERTRAAHLKFGVVHAYDPCIPAERQAANFVTIVPRDAELLPPAIDLKKLADKCDDPMRETAVESELTTFLNQVEGHVGKPAVLKLSREFEERYGIAARIERGLWLEEDWMQPDYAGRPWTLWTANSSLRTAASPDALRWVVVQP
ncbi:lysozyme [Altererythrobacter atlanticus]|uniref:Glycosyl hydrolases family 25 n=1 Tax=Croceibacterium atlanticum TaxID=1267766 RepID=A0A0F7KT32_9SPHN|nr:glycoside hydrolase family 25 protein [Croceibacterium atlanticum]AKH42759.1 Glycosyl hydrolases family 25 [Croceibacterium atlanticum]MBB5731540.1 lysozyme [Croceibacterium atlanticum]